MHVPLLDLRAQYAPLKPAIQSAISELCDTQYFVLGPKVEEFEQEEPSVPLVEVGDRYVVAERGERTGPTERSRSRGPGRSRRAAGPGAPAAAGRA